MVGTLIVGPKRTLSFRRPTKSPYLVAAYTALPLAVQVPHAIGPQTPYLEDTPAKLYVFPRLRFPLFDGVAGLRHRQPAGDLEQERDTNVGPHHRD